MTDIFDLSDAAVERLADLDPIMATHLGLPGRDHLWPDLTVDGHGARRELWADLMASAQGAECRDHRSAVAQRVLIDDARVAVDAHDDGAHLRDLNSIASSFQGVKEVFDVMATDTLDDWMAIITRLETIDVPLSQYRDTLLAGIDAGRAVARRQVTAVAAEAGIAAGDESSYSALVTACGETELTPRLVAAVDHAKAQFAAMAEWLETDYLPHARTTDGCGRDQYEKEARRHLGMTIDIEQTYAWGWAEIDRLTRRMEEVAARIDPAADLRSVIHRLSTDPERGVATVEEFIATMQAVQDRAVEQLAGSHFDVPDQIRHVDVKISPPGGALAPYYNGPSEDFSRPGAVWYPIGSRTFFPLWEEMTTAYHEGFPGHHLQVGVQAALGDELSRFHRLAVWWPGSGEGWALYAEHLMGELGFLDRPEYELGMLAAQMFRACRVVIDIGSHCEIPIPADSSFHPGEAWTWELAAEMIDEVGHQPREMAESEATRYLGWPGQAITYKVGEQVILDLRDELSGRDGFDLKAFHTKVLGVGSIGLDLLQELVLVE